MKTIGRKKKRRWERTRIEEEREKEGDQGLDTVNGLRWIDIKIPP